MKDIKITEIFCELMSGFVLLAMLVPFLHVTHVATVPSIAKFILDHLNGATVTGGIVIFYFLGLIMDAVGLSLGEFFLDKWICRINPSFSQVQKFWENVSAHLLQYRDTQWAYYSMYRNLFILLIPGGILWSCTIWSFSGWVWGITILFISLFLVFCIWMTMTTLLNIYNTITSSAYNDDTVDRPKQRQPTRLKVNEKK